MTANELLSEFTIEDIMSNVTVITEGADVQDVGHAGIVITGVVNSQGNLV